ncbi:hypothetical protein LL973_25235 [Xanthomonas campestris pv. nigromaculans]|nr:hypothetical protein [Xanthomonas campestris pv. nigromaculans]
MSELNRICAACIKEPYLGSIIASTGTAADCDYCGKTVPTVVLEELERVMNFEIERLHFQASGS